MGEVNIGTERDLTLASLGGDSVSFREYLRGDWSEAEAAVSPNGRWMAFFSDELGGREIFVRGFPEPLGQWRVSEGNAIDPLWAPDGSALYYVAPPSLMKVDVVTEGTFSHEPPTALFAWAYDGGTRFNIGYDIHPDGDRFLVAAGGGYGLGDVYIVTNWFEELRQRMGN